VLWENDEMIVAIKERERFPPEYDIGVIIGQKLGANVPSEHYILFAKMGIVGQAICEKIARMKLASNLIVLYADDETFRNSDGSRPIIEDGQKPNDLHLHVFGKKYENANWPFSQSEMQKIADCVARRVKIIRKFLK